MRKKYGKKKRTRKNTNFRKRRVGKTVKRYVKRAIDNLIEDKWLDTRLANATTPNYTGILTNIGVPSAGTGQGQRIGNSIKPKYLKIWGQYYGTNEHMLRIIIFQWHGIDIPVANQIMDPLYGGTFGVCQAPLNPVISGNRQYTVMYDKVLKTGTANGRFNFPIKRNLKKMRKMTFSTATGAGLTNLVYMLTFQDGFATLNTLDLWARFVYEDA